MVFESLVVDVLNRFLGDYVVNLDSSQLKLGIWGGTKAVRNVLEILSGPTKTVPNYHCGGSGKIVGFIGDHLSVTSIPMAQLLTFYGYTQVDFEPQKHIHCHLLLVSKRKPCFPLETQMVGVDWSAAVISEDLRMIRSPDYACETYMLCMCMLDLELHQLRVDASRMLDIELFELTRLDHVSLEKLYFWNAVKFGFYELANMPNVMGAIDCMHVALVRPVPDEILHSEIKLKAKGISLFMALLVSLNYYIIVSHGATHPLLSNRDSYPFYFRTIHSVHLHFSAITKILKHFSWNWVGIIGSGDDAAEQESELLATYLRKEGVCVEFTLHVYFHTDKQSSKKLDAVFKSSYSNIYILCGTINTFMMEFILELQVLRNRTCIIPPSLMKELDITERVSFLSQAFTFSLGIFPAVSLGNSSDTVFLFPDSYKEGWKRFLQEVHPNKYPNDALLGDIWMLLQRCCLPQRMNNSVYAMFNPDSRNCTGNESPRELTIFLDSYFHPLINKAIATITDALISFYSFVTQKLTKNHMKPWEYRHKLQHYIKSAYDIVGKEKRKRFNDKGEMNTDYFIANCVLDSKIAEYRIVGHIISRTQPEQIYINSSLITWKTGNRAPRSQCSKNCPVGTRKVQANSVHVCCYDCVPCSEGEISNITDSENCIKCWDSEWPNDEKTKCIPKVQEYLSYSEGLAIGLSSVSLLFSVITALIIVIFMRHQNTPIVKANNKNLSFILLGAIILSLFCVFLFIGRPVDGTCMLRQALFGIIFSVAVSSVLAKTVMVSLAFKASKPGSKWKQMVSVKVTTCIVVLCSSVQMIISIIWLVLYPPFQELDTHSYKNKIIVQCNEGSVVCFYLMQGYMGLLAAVSFVIAYVARLLPDSFNEAKYITFSMLMFCSVRIAMIPAYLSTKGKYMVAVEIFAILASNAGLLGCIFFPKCYIILFKPTMNTKSFILSH
ncbi:vomeronasal type-2 receptor 26-like [Gastrophryne carolinensis]